MMLHPAIRFAQPSDALGLAKLRYALRSTTGKVNEAEPDFVKRCTAWMEARLSEEDSWRCWLAESDKGELIGALWIQLVEKIPNPRSEPERHAYLTNFYVAECARGEGIGSRMLKSAIEWCRTLDVHAVILWPTQRSRSLYERHGFAAPADIMELVITTAKETENVSQHQNPAQLQTTGH
jgi:GNAT superfamily N-acetyltransferase